MVNQQPEALRLAESMELYPVLFERDAEAAAELRRLHAENEDFRATIDRLIRETSEQIGEIVALKEQRDELLEALELFPGFTDDATIGDSWLCKVGSTIAQTGGAA